MHDPRQANQPQVSTTVVSVWAGPTHRITTPSPEDTFSYADTDPIQRGATVFTRRGDHRSHGWLNAYDTISQHT